MDFEKICIAVVTVGQIFPFIFDCDALGRGPEEMILRGYPRFIHQNDHKGCKRDVLDARGHFLLRFCAAGDKPSGGW